MQAHASHRLRLRSLPKTAPQMAQARRAPGPEAPFVPTRERSTQGLEMRHAAFSVASSSGAAAKFPATTASTAA